MCRRLHLGAGGIRRLLDSPLVPLIDPSWYHLGDFEVEPPRVRPATGLRRQKADTSLAARWHAATRRTNYRAFLYTKGDRLGFDDDTFSFAFSEHFFEHLFLEEACELFKECFRVLAPGGCLRTVVPDADLRTYEATEPVGCGNDSNDWLDPHKHKSRWSIYSLPYVLEQFGFRCRGLVYCDRFGKYHCDPPAEDEGFYAGCVETRFIQDVTYIRRFHHSLVVDGVKPAHPQGFRPRGAVLTGESMQSGDGRV